MSYNGHHTGKSPKYDRNGGRRFERLAMKQKTWLYNIGCGAVFIKPQVGGTLPAIEGAVLNLTKPTEKAQSGALNQHYKAVNRCILLFETPELMNKVTKEQDHNPDLNQRG